MDSETPLDRAHAAMQAAPEDARARLRFYERVADSELVLLLSGEARGDTLDPETVEIDAATYVLAFDGEARLARFAGAAAAYAALPGRVAVRMLAEQGAGLALNPEVAPSATLLPPEAVTWLAGALDNPPDEAEARITAVAAPAGLPEGLLRALDAKLAGAAGLAETAYLVQATYEGGARNHLLAVVGARAGAERTLARAVAEALTFTGLEAGALDVSFVAPGEPIVARLDRHGLRFDLPQPVAEVPTAPAAPGRDPDKPPILK
ncbi:SseB family protein [Sediminimonas sp.]|uniref:SseB family protein n=1 Tax=Sediminimonas sp. TaxID=2823379 RepID=UPI0025DD3EA3|nr:SseB family protein [Sediminimonas sp.]